MGKDIDFHLHCIGVVQEISGTVIIKLRIKIYWHVKISLDVRETTLNVLFVIWVTGNPLRLKKTQH